jgi:hypothetical protein
VSRNPVPPPLIDVLDTLATNPDEAVQKFVALSRWKGKKRSVLSPERIGQELGKAYREEVARILGQQVYLLLYEDDSSKDLLHRSVRVGERLQVPSAEALRLRATRAIEATNVGMTGIEAERTLLEGIAKAEARRKRLEMLLTAWPCAVNGPAPRDCWSRPFSGR